MNDTSSVLPDHPFWRFSLDVYQCPLVRGALLYFQREYGLNVNMLLFCCWWAKSGRGTLTARNIQQLLSQIVLWHQQVVLRLREMRQALKNKTLPSRTQTCRQLLLEEELQAEHIEQLILADALVQTRLSVSTRPRQAVLDACRSLRTYFRNQQILALMEYKQLVQLLAKVFPQADAEIITAICQKIFAAKQREGTSVRQYALFSS